MTFSFIRCRNEKNKSHRASRYKEAAACDTAQKGFDEMKIKDREKRKKKDIVSFSSRLNGLRYLGWDGRPLMEPC